MITPTKDKRQNANQMRAAAAVVRKYEPLLSQLALHLDLPRQCMGMYVIESQLFLAESKFGKDSTDNAMTVAVAALAGQLLNVRMAQHAASSLGLSLSQAVSEMKRAKYEMAHNLAQWLQSLPGHGGKSADDYADMLRKLHDLTYPIIMFMSPG